ncbi:MAG: undecaprenyl-diphosphate phosphatase [Methanobacteriota archaeon]
MDWLVALLLGIVQGVTEWLPLSSSGHLALAQIYLGEVSVAYDVVLHLATVAVACIYLRKDIAAIIADWLAGVGEAFGAEDRKEALFGRKERLWGWLILLASVPTAIIGYAIDRHLGGGDFTSLAIIGAGFVATGFFLAATKLARPRGGRIGAGGALAIGTAQGASVLSSLSRSGLTIGTGIFLGASLEDAAKFSFLALIPATLGAAVLKLGEIGHIASADLAPAALGALAAALVGYACLEAMMRVVRRGGLHWFAPYCLALGVGVLSWSLL